MNTGSSRKSRKSKALSPDYIQLDERAMQDMIISTLAYAKNVNYYNENDRPDGDWESFFLNDPIFIIALISETDIISFKENNDAVNYKPLQNNSDPDTTIQVKASIKMKNVYQLVNTVRHWNQLLKKSNYKGTVVHEIDDLVKAIGTYITTINPLFSRLEKEDRYVDLPKEIRDKIFFDFNLEFNDTKISALPNIDMEGVFNILNQEFNNIYTDIIYFKESVSKKFQENLNLVHNHLPHIGLLLGFFKVFKYAQIELNNITKKHLDYYYRDLLQQKQIQDSQWHKTMVSCILSKGVENLILPKNTAFNFDIGFENDVLFTTKTVTQLNRATISDIKTIYKSTHEPFVTKHQTDAFQYNMLFKDDILKRIQARNAFQTNTFDDYPLIFGEENDSLAEVGFLISSPALILEKGNQVVTLELKFIDDLFNEHTSSCFAKLFNEELDIFLKKNPKITASEKEIKKTNLKENIKIRFFNQAFNIYITDDEGWKKIEYSKTTAKGKLVSIRIPLKSLSDQLISYNPDLHEGGFDAVWPCIKILLNNDATYHPYAFLKPGTLEYIRIIADVTDVSRLNLSNSNGEIDHTIPFAPFGAIPEIGSFLRIQNPIILQKNLSALSFSINWNGLPQLKDGFKTYYAEYNQEITNDSFKAFIAQTRNLDRTASVFKHIEFNLFESDAYRYLKNSRVIDVNLDDFQLNNKMVQVTAKSGEDKTSIYVILKRPNIGFGHQVFPQIYAKAAMESSRLFKRNVPLPNQPYTPIIDQLRVAYRNTAKESVLRKQDAESADVTLVHIHPFGHSVVFPGSIKSECFLLPQINKKGNLYIALQNIMPGDVVSIGFDLIPAVYIHSVIKVPRISWKYLCNNDWVDYTEMVLEEETKGLIKSGIIKVQIPYAVEFENTRMESGKFWIKVEFDGAEDINSRVKNIFTQAVDLTSKAKISRPDFDEKLRNNKLKISAIGHKDIDVITGPIHFESHDNKEDETMYYTRVSEQLRHKKRGVTHWDIERMVLDEFQQIEKVRVYGRNNYPNELVQGSNTQIVLIPKHNTSGNTFYQGNKLDVDTLNEIKNYIKSYVSPYMKIEVCNPVFESLKVRCRVQFFEVQKSRDLRDKLNEELVMFLSPDVMDFNNDILFDRSFTTTEILNFINGRPYVEKVTHFSVIQLVDVIDKHRVIDTEKDNGRFSSTTSEVNDDSKKIWELKTISAYAILTSAKKHHIEVLLPETDIETDLENKIQGIGDLSIGSDFVVINEKGVYIDD
ncbi:hypothetical protein ACFFU1_17810 [Algibacter miyuki]|uniref:Baseplate protein J-like domain-containing protein n=1 Tax=Algibacter miyuki TaxID=1306933 RepID=A0ABV5H4D2_9FLAO|nr:hypothetical protein [Algibacter miyuki]MDN3663821.1 hypothetical protein [Algibacter miyuki]